METQRLDDGYIIRQLRTMMKEHHSPPEGRASLMTDDGLAQ
jgi:hypothetical protein